MKKNEKKKNSWMQKIRDEEMLKRVGERGTMLETLMKIKRNWLGHWLRTDCIVTDLIQVMVEVKENSEDEF